MACVNAYFCGMYRLTFPLLLFVLVAFSACRKVSATQSEVPPVTEFEHKTPKLPTLLVDTTRGQYAWMGHYNFVQSILNRIPTPEGYGRVNVLEDSFGWWLRRIPLKPGRPVVKLFDGSDKGNQDVHHAVVNIDAGTKDLQQCADAVMRLRAEYLYSAKRDGEISFKFTSGDACPWEKWKAGQRPVVQGNSVTWKGGGKTGREYANFRAYMDQVFLYAGTASLEKELKPVASLRDVQVGDVFIKGGFPGHAVIVMDVAEHRENEERVFLLAQSYMPAQDIHILRNPNDEGLSPWYSLEGARSLVTPEWEFVLPSSHKRF